MRFGRQYPRAACVRRKQKRRKEEKLKKDGKYEMCTFVSEPDDIRRKMDSLWGRGGLYIKKRSGGGRREAGMGGSRFSRRPDARREKRDRRYIGKVRPLGWF